MQSFSSNVEDKSSESGFQFVFKCELCSTSFESTYVASNAAKEKALFNDVSKFGGMFSNKASIVGALGGQAYKTPAWNKEHDAAFKKATDEATAHFHQCPKCHKYVCDNDWNKDASLCAIDAAEAAAAAAPPAPPAAKEIPAICPKCGKPTGGGNFCNNCGAPLGPVKCAACGTENAPGAKFCGGCGAKL